jgi:hypothetical protein
MTTVDMTADETPVIEVGVDPLDVSMIDGVAEVEAIEIETGGDIR